METKQDYLQFKNDILKDIRNLDKKISEQIKKKMIYMIQLLKI